jgi:hypothetical protein
MPCIQQQLLLVILYTFASDVAGRPHEAQTAQMPDTQVLISAYSKILDQFRVGDSNAVTVDHLSAAISDLQKIIPSKPKRLNVRSTEDVCSDSTVVSNLNFCSVLNGAHVSSERLGIVPIIEAVGPEMIKNLTDESPWVTLNCKKAFSNLLCLMTFQLCDGSRQIFPCLPYCSEYASACGNFSGTEAESICSQSSSEIGNFSSDPDCYCGGSRGPNDVCLASPESCPAPAAERCCTRLMNNPRATFTLDVPNPSAIASITVWNAASAGSPLLGADASDLQLQRAIVSVQSAHSTTECLLASSTAAKPGFAARRLFCGVAGTKVQLSLAELLPPAPSAARLAVRTCLVDASAASQVADATLWIQQAGSGPGTGSL